MTKTEVNKSTVELTAVEIRALLVAIEATRAATPRPGGLDTLGALSRVEKKLMRARILCPRCGGRIETTRNGRVMYCVGCGTPYELRATA